jgi:hypothetical protein
MQRYKQLTKGIHKQTSVIYIAKLSWIALKCFIFSSTIEVYKKMGANGLSISDIIIKQL